MGLSHYYALLFFCSSLRYLNLPGYIPESVFHKESSTSLHSYHQRQSVVTQPLHLCVHRGVQGSGIEMVCGSHLKGCSKEVICTQLWLCGKGLMCFSRSPLLCGMHPVVQCCVVKGWCLERFQTNKWLCCSGETCEQCIQSNMKSQCLHSTVKLKSTPLPSLAGNQEGYWHPCHAPRVLLFRIPLSVMMWRHWDRLFSVHLGLASTQLCPFEHT